MGANPRWLTYLLLVGVGVGAQSALAQTDTDMEQLKERLSEVEERLEDAEGDQAPWDKYVDEFGGRIMFDQTWAFGEDQGLENAVNGNNNLEEGAELRRVRFFAEGSVAPWLAYKLQIDFAGGAEAKDVYMQAHGLGSMPSVKVGHFKEPLSLQEQTSSKYISLMSRTMLADEVGSVGRNAGIMLTDHFANDRLNVALGVFNPNFGNWETPSGSSNEGNVSITGRVTSPILYSDGGDRVLHVGAGFSHRKVDSFSLGQEPEVHKTDDFISGTVANVDSRQIYGAELAGVFGPAHAQAEYVRSNINTPNGPDPDIDTYYVQGGVVLTGESRPYDKADGDFGRIKPASPFTGLGSGPGAWEVVGRYSVMDAEEMANAASFNGNLPGLAAGDPANVAELNVFSAGINWYPVAHAKWMLNFVHADQDALGESNFLATRFQVDF